MNNAVQIFKNNQFGELRTIIREGEFWFIGKDVADILGYKNGSRDIKAHVDEEDRKFLKGTEMVGLKNASSFGATIINESGLYSLILSSKLPKAKEFKRWVTNEVLPSIRKTGAYIKEDDLLIDDKTGFRGVEPIGNNTTDIIRIINGTLFTNSCIVAEKFGIAQADIVENIKRIIKALSLNPAKNMYFTRDNLNSMLYYITQEGFSLITMGFTSQKAIIWKAIFLKDFNSRQAMCNGESIAKDRILTNSERLGILSAEPRLDIRNNDVFKNQLEAIKKDMTMVEYMIDNFPTVMHPSYFEGYSAVLRRAFLNLYNKIDDIGDIKFNYIHK